MPEDIGRTINDPSATDVADLANLIDSKKEDVDRDIASDNKEYKCLSCGYVGPEEECPDCGELMGRDVEPVDQDEAALGLKSEGIERFLASTKSILENGKRYGKEAVCAALNLSWRHHVDKIPAAALTESIAHTIQKLSRIFPGFRPLFESEITAMSDKGKYFGKSIKSDHSEHLSDQPTEMKEHGSVDTKLRGRPKNTAEKTPYIPGTSKGLGENRLKDANLKVMRENVSKLASIVKKSIKEGALSLRSGNHKVNFTVLVTEGQWKKRTTRRRKLAEAIADVEEILQFHNPDDVMLEAWYINGAGYISKKHDINLVRVAQRGPVVAEGKAIFRFKRNAERFADYLAESGVPCRVAGHNWGAAVSARVTMEAANKAFATISEAWYDPRSWFKKKDPMLQNKYMGAKYNDDNVTPTGGLSGAADSERQAESQKLKPSDPRADLEAEYNAELERRGQVRPSGPAGAQLARQGTGKLRQRLSAQFSDIMASIRNARSVIKSLQESLIRRGILSEDESSVFGDIDFEKAAQPLQDVAARQAGQMTSAGRTAAKAAGTFDLERQLAAIRMPDEQGYTQADEQKLLGLIRKINMDMITTNKQLLGYGRVAARTGQGYAAAQSGLERQAAPLAQSAAARGAEAARRLEKGYAGGAMQFAQSSPSSIAALRGKNPQDAVVGDFSRPRMESRSKGKMIGEASEAINQALAQLRKSLEIFKTNVQKAQGRAQEKASARLAGQKQTAVARQAAAAQQADLRRRGYGFGPGPGGTMTTQRSITPTTPLSQNDDDDANLLFSNPRKPAGRPAY